MLLTPRTQRRRAAQLALLVKLDRYLKLSWVHPNHLPKLEVDDLPVGDSWTTFSVTDSTFFRV